MLRKKDFKLQSNMYLKKTFLIASNYSGMLEVGGRAYAPPSHFLPPRYNSPFPRFSSFDMIEYFCNYIFDIYVLVLNKILIIIFLLALKSNGDDRPRFTEVKPKALRATAELGKVVTFEAVTAGQKPIGE